MSLDSAEKVKLALSQENFLTSKPIPGESKDEFRKRQKNEDQFELEKLGIDESHEALSKRTIIEGIMVPRMKEMFTLILNDFKKQDLLPLIPAGLVLSGGGAETVGIVEVAKRTMNLPARVGRPTELRGLIDDIQKPSYATSIGLLVYAAKHSLQKAPVQTTQFSNPLKNIKLGGAFSKIIGIVKSFLP